MRIEPDDAPEPVENDPSAEYGYRVLPGCVKFCWYGPADRSFPFIRTVTAADEWPDFAAHQANMDCRASRESHGMLLCPDGEMVAAVCPGDEIVVPYTMFLTIISRH
jgi:hypothetical protein